MNVLQNLMELYNSLSLDNTYRVVIKGILENLDKMEAVTVYDVAEMTNSSRTTVWRMVQKLGYNNFNDFRHALQNAVQDYIYYNRMIPKKYCSDTDKLLGKIKNSMLESWELLEDNLSSELLEELTDEIFEADKIRFYLPFRMPSIYSFQQNLAMAGKDTAYCVLLPEIVEDAEELTEDSIVFISTIEFAETMNMKPAFEAISRHGAKIWLAGDSSSRYSHYADRILLDERVAPISGLAAYQTIYLALSEYFRAKYIDK